MKTEHRHIIRKLAITVDCPDKATGMALHSNLGDIVQNALLPEISILFDQLGDIRLDRLEIELKDLPAEHWEAALRAQLPQQVRKALQSFVAAKPPEPHGSSLGQASGDTFSQWLFFLRSGRLPWWAESRHLAAIEREVRESRFLNTPAALDELRALLQKNTSALKRMIRQAEPQTLQAVWKSMVPQNSTARMDLPQDLLRLLSGYYSADFVKQVSLEAAFSAILADEAATFEKAPGPMSIRLLLRILKLHSPLPLRLEKALIRMAGPENSGRQSKQSEPSGAAQPNNAHPPGQRKLATANPKTDDQPNWESLPDAESFFVTNAGVVLLYPFLQYFFQDLGLLDDNRFKSEAAQETAVQWLHFLATGSRECPEPELLLPKILCNMPIEKPVDRWFEPETPQVEEAESMLAAAIRHWAVLKNTSPDGLREGFLRRQGKLEILADQSLKLTVERQLQDILLEQLPWTIGIIRLPWMDRLLYVEW